MQSRTINSCHFQWNLSRCSSWRPRINENHAKYALALVHSRRCSTFGPEASSVFHGRQLLWGKFPFNAFSFPSHEGGGGLAAQSFLLPENGQYAITEHKTLNIKIIKFQGVNHSGWRLLNSEGSCLNTDNEVVGPE